MSTFLMIPLNEQGVFTDTSLVQALRDAAAAAAQFSDVFLYSHGWWTNANAAMLDYDRFTAGFDRALGTDPMTQGLVHQPMSTFLATGIHWPSVLTEDSLSALNYLEASSYFTMRERADDVGTNGGYAVLRSALPALQSAPAPAAARLNLIGHSFGCRVVCSALAKFLVGLGPNDLPRLRVSIVLLQAAFDQGDLSPQGPYAPVLADRRVRVLITKSTKDWSLTDGYPIANLVWDVVNHAGFASVAKGLPTILESAIGAGLAPAQLAAQLADRFVHMNAATPAQRPNLLARLQGLLGTKLGTIGGDLETLGMNVLGEAAAALGHTVPVALGSAGPTAAVVANAGTDGASGTIGQNWPTPGAGTLATGDVNKKLVVADLTPLHTAREGVAWPGQDHHSDINALEIYRLVAGFLLA